MSYAYEWFGESTKNFFHLKNVAPGLATKKPHRGWRQKPAG
jgi:hypothetical protein